MDFISCYETQPAILMEGAIGTRIQREYGMTFDVDVALAGFIYEDKTRNAITNIWKEYITIAKKYRLPFIVTTLTRRANKERVVRSKFDKYILRDNLSFLKQLKESEKANMYIGGCMGCKGDAYKATDVLSVPDSYDFHSWSADLFKAAGVDFLFASIMPALQETIGMAKAMEQTSLPYIISFMIRSNGRLIDGTTIHDAIFQIDQSTERNPLCYMTNCVHPRVLYQALSQDFNQTSLVKKRFKGMQPNASPLTPEELDNATQLISSDGKELAEQVIKLQELVTLQIVGGCCGTDGVYLEQIAKKLSDRYR